MKEKELTGMKKEKELIRLRQLGLSYKAIAEELGTTEGTVKVDFCRLYRKLGIHSTAEFFAHQRTQQESRNKKLARV